MNDLRTAAQQALEAMSSFESGTNGLYEGEFAEEISALRAALVEDAMQKFTDVNQELEAALAEPVQGPVAWIQPDHLQKARKAPFLCRVEPTKRMVDFVALYTDPPQRKPLTEEEIMQCFADAGAIVKGQLWVKVARAIERAHGIT